jgi:glycerol-3-phosphate dehydrogenase
MSPLDGRVMFAIPWRGRLVLGTTDTDFSGDADDVHADADDAQYLCESANQYFPGARFSPDQAISSWAGLRPLIHEEAEEASSVSREHQLYVGEDGVIVVAGGKLTTYRLMAKQLVKSALSWLHREYGEPSRRELLRPRTRKRPLPGAAGLDQAGWPAIESLAAELVSRWNMTESAAAHLAWTYGARARVIAERIAANPTLGEPMQSDLPYLWAEVEFAVSDDLALTLEDVLARRVPLLLVGCDQGLDVADEVARRMAIALGWSEDRRTTELTRYRQVVTASRRFRAAAPARESRLG